MVDFFSIPALLAARDSDSLIGHPWQMTGHMKAGLITGSVGFFLIVLISTIYCIRAHRKKAKGFHRDKNLPEGTFASKKSRLRWPRPRYNMSKEFSKYNDEESRWFYDERKNDMILGVGGLILRQGAWMRPNRNDSAYSPGA